MKRTHQPIALGVLGGIDVLSQVPHLRQKHISQVLVSAITHLLDLVRAESVHHILLPNLVVHESLEEGVTLEEIVDINQLPISEIDTEGVNIVLILMVDQTDLLGILQLALE